MLLTFSSLSLSSLCVRRLIGLKHTECERENAAHSYLIKYSNSSFVELRLILCSLFHPPSLSLSPLFSLPLMQFTCNCNGAGWLFNKTLALNQCKWGVCNVLLFDRKLHGQLLCQEMSKSNLLLLSPSASLTHTLKSRHRKWLGQAISLIYLRSICRPAVQLRHRARTREWES